MVATLSPVGQSQVGEQSARLLGGRQNNFLRLAHNRQFAEHLNL